MRLYLSIAFLFFSLFAFAQKQQTKTISFQLDTIRRDSFFLVQTVTTSIEGDPRPQTETTPQIFKSPEQLDLFVSNLETDAKRVMDQALKYQEAAQLLSYKAQMIRTLKEKHTWWKPKETPKVAVGPPVDVPKKDIEKLVKKPVKKKKKSK